MNASNPGPGALRHVLKNGTGPVLVAVHNYPDPDSLASALGLQVLLESWGMESHIADGSGIGRAENKAMAGLLKIGTRTFSELSLPHYRGAILADTQPDVGNNDLPDSVPLLAVLDHHPFVEENCREVPYVDVRPEYGATSTILHEYLQAAGVEMDTRLATALYLGIRTDTESLERHATPADVAAYTALLPLVDLAVVRKITRPPLSGDYFSMLQRAIQAGQRYDEAVVSFLGSVEQPDTLSIVAELLLQAKGASYALALGTNKERLYLSLRISPPRKGAGFLMQQTVGGVGTGGGHALAAGGVIDPEGGERERGDAGDGRSTAAQTAILRFLEAVGANPENGRPLCPKERTSGGGEETGLPSPDGSSG